jgi:hypothetical protein
MLQHLNGPSRFSFVSNRGSAELSDATHALDRSAGVCFVVIHEYTASRPKRTPEYLSQATRIAISGH